MAREVSMVIFAKVIFPKGKARRGRHPAAQKRQVNHEYGLKALGQGGQAATKDAKI
jgi:hypothetical protein